MTKKEQIALLKMAMSFGATYIFIFALITKDYSNIFIGFVLLLVPMFVRDGKTKNNKKKIETEKSIDMKFLIKKWYDEFIKWLNK